jgi:hypothetical protein
VALATQRAGGDEQCRWERERRNEHTDRCGRQLGAIATETAFQSNRGRRRNGDRTDVRQDREIAAAMPKRLSGRTMIAS